MTIWHKSDVKGDNVFVFSHWRNAYKTDCQNMWFVSFSIHDRY